MKKYSFIIVCMIIAFAVSGWIAVSAIADMAGRTNGTTAATVDTNTTAATQGGYATLPTLGSLPVYVHPSTTAPLASTEPTTTTDYSLPEELDIYFDFAQSHKPTEAEIAQIAYGTDVADVVQLLGKPHDFGPTSGLLSIAWQTVEGNWYYMIILSRGKNHNSIFEEIFEYGYCASVGVYSGGPSELFYYKNSLSEP